MLEGQPANFSLLLEQSRQLTNHIVQPDVPQLERGLDQIDAESKRLFKRTTRVAESGNASVGTGGPTNMDARTIYMFANRGYEPEKVRETLDQIDLAQSLEPLNGVRDTDIEGFLRNEYENIVTGAILKTKRETAKRYQASFDRLLYQDWERCRKKLFQELGQHHTPWSGPDQIQGLKMSQARSAPSGSQARSAVLTGEGKGSTATHPRLAAYARVVREINDKRRTGQELESLIALWEAAASVTVNEPSQRMVLKYWSLLFRMLGGDPKRIRDPSRQPLRARQYAKLYADNSGKPDAAEFRQQMAYGARAWLEDEYYSWLSGYVRNQRAILGGTPTVHSEVRSALELRLSRNGRWMNSLQIVDGQPFWAHVFTLMRCGLLKQATEYIEQHSTFLQSSSPDFAVYFRAWMQDPSRRLPTDLRNRLIKEWNSKIRDRNTGNEVDPFKVALYKIIGRCDMTNKGLKDRSVITSTEDYVWLQLMLTQEHVLETDATQEQYTLRDVALQLQRYGAAHFNNPMVWIQVLMLSGEFELAVSELLKQEAFSVDAIHFAMAMVNYGVLRVPDSPYDVHEAKLLINGDQITRPSGVYQLRTFNFAQLISACVLQMAKEDPSGALQYVLFLGLLGAPLSQQDATRAVSRGTDTISQSGGRRYTNFSHMLIREIIVRSGEFEALVGEVRPNGTRVPGEVERYQTLVHIYSTEDFKQFITIQAAEKAEHQGHFQDAIRLHNLAGEHGRVIELLNRQLSDRLLEQRYREQPRSMTQKAFATHRTDVFPREDEPVELAQQVLSFYQNHPQMLAKIDVESKQTCEVLLSLTRFMMACARGATQDALPHLLGTGIVPTRMDMAEIQQKANDFKLLSDSVTKVMPDILVTASTMVFEMYQTLTKQRVNAMEASTRDRQLLGLKDLAKALTLFAGSLQYRIPGDTLTVMNRMLVLMG
ncbi:Nup93/Nic96-domain-containing protein [Powellomyces hirtus]|nr:Nup93/Nic96-domain-containing protein [Powellomyces hirtus]